MSQDASLRGNTAFDHGLRVRTQRALLSPLRYGSYHVARPCHNDATDRHFVTEGVSHNEKPVQI
jgi:hypothetical protein